jgi:hypothetical protein
MKISLQRRFAYAIAFFSIAVPVLIMFQNIQAGIVLLLLGVYITVRTIRNIAPNDPNMVSDSTLHHIGLHQSNRGQIIYVQLVDDFGRDLPTNVAQKLIEDAQARANPRDTVVGLHRIINKTNP